MSTTTDPCKICKGSHGVDPAVLCHHCLNGTLLQDVLAAHPDKAASINDAPTILTDAAATINQRAQQRDQIAERSMKRTVETFNALTGSDITEEQGWLFMVCLKLARSTNGRTYHRDDFIDAAAYVALAAETASQQQ